MLLEVLLLSDKKEEQDDKCEGFDEEQKVQEIADIERQGKEER